MTPLNTPEKKIATIEKRIKLYQQKRSKASLVVFYDNAIKNLTDEKKRLRSLLVMEQRKNKNTLIAFQNG